MSPCKAFAVLILCSTAGAQDFAIRGHVEVIHRAKHQTGSADVVVWLTTSQPLASKSTTATRIIQKDKRFSPHVVAVSVGSEIEFPNQDPLFHDVFSIYRGKPFDLGLYESGASRKVKFSHPGVSYIFCNIHPEMSAAVIALPTPYFAVTGDDGTFHINHVAPGVYKMEFWYELASESELKSLAREVEPSAESATVNITLHSSDTPPQHLNKYGQEYTITNPKSY